jgi:hypothetical protein
MELKIGLVEWSGARTLKVPNLVILVVIAGFGTFSVRARASSGNPTMNPAIRERTCFFEDRRSREISILSGTYLAQ